MIAFAAARIADDSDVVAQSMGGIVAIGLALTYPEKIRRLVLVATSGGVDVDHLRLEDWRAEYRQEFPEAGTWVASDRVDFTEQLHRVVAPMRLSGATPIRTALLLSARRFIVCSRRARYTSCTAVRIRWLAITPTM